MHVLAFPLHIHRINSCEIMRIALSLIPIALIGFVMLSCPSAVASLCQTVSVSLTYPRQTLPKGTVPVWTRVNGSCTSDGEDYFAVRVDLLANSSSVMLSSNSTPVGYNANNFSVRVENVATSPMNNQSWPIQVNTYLVQSGAAFGKSLLNATTIYIQVGGAVPELPFNPSLALAVVLMAAMVGMRWRSKWDGERFD